MPTGARRVGSRGVADRRVERDASLDWWWGVAAATALSAALRLRFVWTPITSDEGGYLAISRAWGHGAVLYRDVWVDRPQGLLLLDRVWSAIGLGTPSGIRVLAVVAGGVAVIACASIAKTLCGPVASVLAAVFVAVLSSAPEYEGFTANGELLSGAIGACCLAVALIALDEPVRLRWLFAAGLLGGAAISLKQSGFDALLAAVVAIVAIAVVQPRRRHDVLRGLGALVAGVGTLIGVLALHGALTGWQRWWYAFAGYRLTERSIATNADFGRFGTTWMIAAPIIIPALVAAAACLVWCRHSTWMSLCPLLSWAAFATVAFAAGGQFHRHYWVILSFPLGTLAAATLSLHPHAAARLAIAGLVVAVPLVHAARSALLSRDQVAVRLDADTRLSKDEDLADWFRVRGQSGETFYVLCASAAFYANANEDPPYPYLWFDNVVQVPGARSRLSSMLSSPERPTYVAVYQPPDQCDQSGAAGHVLRQDYEFFDRVDGIDIYRVDI